MRSMSDGDGEALARRYYEAVNGGDLTALDGLLAADYRSHRRGVPPGRETVKAFLAHFRAAFPDVSFAVDFIVTSGDLVFARTRTSGTHEAEYFGHPPTGARFVATGIDVFRVVDGRLAEHWGEFDTFGMLQQLGLVDTGAGAAT
jgi:steroid delta-isomerase-like uncharacterized protein